MAYAFYISNQTLDEFAGIELELYYVHDMEIRRHGNRLATYKYESNITSNKEALLEEDFTFTMRYLIIPLTVKINTPYNTYINFGFALNAIIDAELKGSIYSYVDKEVDFTLLVDQKMTQNQSGMIILNDMI